MNLVETLRQIPGARLTGALPLAMTYSTEFLLPTIGSSTRPLMQLVAHPSLGVDFHSPQKLTGQHVHGLPPYAKVRAYETDAYPAAPQGWMRGSGRDRSYFVPVEADRGLWLDFNAVASHPKKHVAVLISIQGLNPVTGRPAGLALEQHDLDCPIHNHAFEGGRFCKECGFAWPKQNYLCTTGQPYGQMWLDGFRGADGTVRQYYFTAETAKGVATQLLGEKRVFALGVAFFLSKKDKPEPTRGLVRSGQLYGASLGLIGDTSLGLFKGSGSANASTDNTFQGFHGLVDSSSAVYCSSSIPKVETKVTDFCSFADPLATSRDEAALDEGTIDLSWQNSKLEIAAGEKIDQQVYDDPEKLDFWEPEPAGTIYVNYAPVELVNEILKHGQRATQPDGFLQGLKTGA